MSVAIINVVRITIVSDEFKLYISVQMCILHFLYVLQETFSPQESSLKACSQ